MKKTKQILAVILLITAVGTGVMVYGSSQKDVKADSEQLAAPQALPVDVVQVKEEDTQIWKNFSGQVVAVDHADIRPQVSGQIIEIRFKDGEYVKKGDVLVVIDPLPYKAALNQAQAALDAAVTRATLAEKEYRRARKLIETEAISQGLLDERTNNRLSASAAVDGAKAALESAKIDLDYAYVKAPISGKVSRAEITEGNIVQSGQNAPVLTSVISDKLVYVDFDVDERSYLRFVKTDASLGSSGKVPVRLLLLDGEFEYQGEVSSFDNRIDPSSGTIRARAVFENKDKLLLPGMSVSVLMGSAQNEKNILVSERAIGTDQDRKFVYIVNEKSMAQYREVKIGDSVDGQRVILSGLEDNETIIAKGLVRIRPGMPVVVKETIEKDTKTSAVQDEKE